MRFLGVFGFGFVLLGRCGQIIFADFVFDIVADFGERFVGKGHAVGTHIGNQADSALSHIDAFIQLLRGAHGAVGGHAQLAHGILLHGGSGKRRGGVAAALFLFYGGHLRFFAFQCFQHIGLRCFIGQGKLLELVAFVLNQLGGEFAAAFVAVEMQRPVFLRFKGANFVFALANQAQSGALHAAGAQAAADFFPQQGRQIEADQIVERAPRLLGINQIHFQRARMGDGIEHGIFGDFVKHHPLRLDVFQAAFGFQNLLQMP